MLSIHNSKRGVQLLKTVCLYVGDRHRVTHRESISDAISIDSYVGCNDLAPFLLRCRVHLQLVWSLAYIQPIRYIFYPLYRRSRCALYYGNLVTCIKAGVKVDVASGKKVLLNISVLGILVGIQELLVGHNDDVRTHRYQLLRLSLAYCLRRHRVFSLKAHRQISRAFVKIKHSLFGVLISLIISCSNKIKGILCYKPHKIRIIFSRQIYTPLPPRRQNGIIVSRHILHIVELTVCNAEVVIISEEHVSPLSCGLHFCKLWIFHLCPP